MKAVFCDDNAMAPCRPPAGGLLTVSNGELEIAVEVPGGSGTYCGTRFAWAGIVAWARFKEHTLFGPWRTGDHPLDEHDTVTGTAGEFGMGTAGMPPPPGFDEAARDGDFVKIGVGVLRRPDEAPYSFGRRYELTDAPAWDVSANEWRVDMRQRLEHGGYGYDYVQRIELVPRRASFITRHTLTNTGHKAIHQTHYSHNFLVVDQQPIGPAYEVTFPFVPVSSLGADDIAYIEGRTLKFRGPVPAGTAVFSLLSGFGGTSADNRVTLCHRDSGVEVRIRGDRPVERFHVFAATGAVCPEPFVGVRVAPGDTATWLHRYDLELKERVSAKS